MRRFSAAGRPGAYLRVTEEGAVAPGDRVLVLDRPAASVTVAESMRAYYGDSALLRRLLKVPGRSPQWDQVARRVLRVAGSASAGYKHAPRTCPRGRRWGRCERHLEAPGGRGIPDMVRACDGEERRRRPTINVDERHADPAENQAHGGHAHPASPVRRICRRATCPQTTAGMVVDAESERLSEPEDKRGDRNPVAAVRAARIHRRIGAGDMVPSGPAGRSLVSAASSA